MAAIFKMAADKIGKIQNDGRWHGNQYANFLKFTRTADPFETWHKNRSSLKVVLGF